VSPESRSPLILHGLVVAAALSAAATLLGGATNDHAPAVFAGWWLSTIALTLGAAAGLRRRFRTVQGVPAISPVLLALFVTPFVYEGVWRLLGQPTNPLEIVLIAGVLLTGLGLAAASAVRQFQPLAMICSLFVTLYSASLSSQLVTCLGAAGFVLTGAAWLAVSHWTTVAGGLPRRVQRRYPLRTVLLSVAALLVPLVGVGATQADRIWALSGWLPSSGGDGLYDPAARSGVGDGDALVAGQENIQSFGPIEDAPFRSSDDPSLYDLFNETYDEPVKIRKQDRAIALPPDLVPMAETQMAKSQQAGKEFSTLRKGQSGRKTEMHSLASSALFYVKGRTPLHLRHEVFDLFDGVTWYPVDPESEERTPQLEMKTRNGRPWLTIEGPPGGLEYFAASENHAIKIVHLKSNRLPTPAHLRGVHIDRLQDVGFYRCEGAGLLAMDRDQLPELTAIHYRSQTVDERRLIEQKYWGRWQDARCRAVPDAADAERLRELAEQWTAGVPAGWPQVQAIVDRLRTDYVHDPEAKASADVASPVLHFLFESRRGPDYQFATAAALLLRSLNLSTRLVGGFYVSPERYDPRKQHTPVVGADTHIWLEVFQMGNVWVTVEPTPGYVVLGPPPTLWERTTAVALAAAAWLSGHWPLVMLAGAFAILAWWQRRRCLDAACVALWRWCPAQDARRRVLQTLRVVDYRLKLRRQARPVGCSPATWYQRLSPLPDTARSSLVQLAQLADWAAYAPRQTPSPGGEAGPSDDICRRAVAALEIPWTSTPS
jgi:protein-glutamine gamma-glutamyltransferase